MRPPLLSCLLILLYQSGWTHGLCNVYNNTATCHKLDDLKYIETQQLESLKIAIDQDILLSDELVNLDNLTHLDLSGGDLRKIEPGSFRTLSNLKSLNLGNNRIDKLESTSLGGLFHLHSLNLRNNALRQLPPTLVRLKTLKHLDIHGNPLECNCATLKVRDLIVQNGVTVSKKMVCAGPGNMNGTSLMSPVTALVCHFEKQDREMQRDQAHEGSGTGRGSAEVSDEDEDEEKEHEHEENEEEDEEDEEEYVEVNNGTSEKPKEPEMETPFPSNATTTSSAIADVSATPKMTTMTSSLQLDSDDEIFFDGDEKKDKHTSTTEISRREHEFKDSLFYPSSGDGDDGSGEGSGAAFSHYDEEKTENTEESSFFSGTILDAFFGLLGTTALPTKDPDLEEEQFIDASSTAKDTDSHPVDSLDKDVGTTIVMPTFVSIGNNVEVLKSANTESKSGNVKAEVDSLNDEQANTSPAKQSKKGMGSYVVLGILLAVVAGLIGFAAYRGKLCNRKRKRGDVENGTEMKDMQKSLLPDMGNSTQPKIASNGNTENAPLVEGTPETDENAKADRHRKEDQETTPRPTNGTADYPDPVKPPRKLPLAQDSEQRPRVDVNSLRENFLADRTSAPHQVSQPAAPPPANASNDSTQDEVPPLSPGAQRVKITLQENPDSVPKTPILITRTMAGENLVKTP